MSWFERIVKETVPDLDTPAASALRADALAVIQMPRDPIDEQVNVPLHISRHVVCSESTSWLGFLPPLIRSRPVNAFDPLPPTTAISTYDNAYFAGIRPSRHAGGVGRGGGLGGGVAMDGLMGRLLGAMGADGWQGRVTDIWREFMGRREFAGVPAEERENMLQQLLDMGQALDPAVRAQAGEGMPGAFPGEEDAEEE